MRRFDTNRWWAHILALSLVLGSMVGVATQGAAADRNAISRPDAFGRTYGDPDATGGTGRQDPDNSLRPVGQTGGTLGGAVGDGATTVGRWIGSLWFAWEIAKTRWLR